MLKLKELRIGNLVLDSTKNTTVVEEIWQERIRYGIPLSEDYLNRFGFKQVNVLHDGTIVYEAEPYFYFNNKDGYGHISIKTPKIRYVHQLQNLYHSLTQKELILK